MSVRRDAFNAGHFRVYSCMMVRYFNEDRKLVLSQTKPLPGYILPYDGEYNPEDGCNNVFANSVGGRYLGAFTCRRFARV